MFISATSEFVWQTCEGLSFCNVLSVELADGFEKKIHTYDIIVLKEGYGAI